MRNPRRALTVALALLLVAGVVTSVLFATRLREAEERLDARADVVRVAETFTVQVNNYDSTSIGDYRSAVGTLLSTRFAAEFDQAMTDIVSSVREAQMSATGSVLASGVATLEEDSARVLVVADSDVSTIFDNRTRHFRWEVDLVKVGGRWVVDDFTPVA